MSAVPGGDRQVYASRRRRLLLAAGLAAIYLTTVSIVFEKDPETGLKPLPNDYLWVVIPGTILIAVLVWRAMKARVVTDRAGVDIVRVVGHEFVPWGQLRRFEVHPTPGKQGSAVLARRDNEVLVKVWTEIMVRPLRDRGQARQLARARADALMARLESDRRAQQPAGSRSGR